MDCIASQRSNGTNGLVFAFLSKLCAALVMGLFDRHIEGCWLEWLYIIYICLSIDFCGTGAARVSEVRGRERVKGKRKEKEKKRKGDRFSSSSHPLMAVRRGNDEMDLKYPVE